VGQRAPLPGQKPTRQRVWLSHGAPASANVTTAHLHWTLAFAQLPTQPRPDTQSVSAEQGAPAGAGSSHVGWGPGGGTEPPGPGVPLTTAPPLEQTSDAAHAAEPHGSPMPTVGCATHFSVASSQDSPGMHPGS
jgi:hypothetical protein